MEPASRSLHGCTILATRPIAGGDHGNDAPDALAEALARSGARVVACPAIELADLAGRNAEAIGRALAATRAAGGWLIVPSPASARGLGRVLARLGWAVGPLPGLRVAAMGAATAQALVRLGVGVTFQPPRAEAAAMAESLPAEPGTPVLILGSTQGRPELPDGLARRGLAVQAIALHEPRPCAEGLARLREALAQERLKRSNPKPRNSGTQASEVDVDASGDSALAACLMLLVASPSAVDAVLDALAPEPESLRGVGWLAIGPATRSRALERGVAEDLTIQATSPDPRSIVQAAWALAERLANSGG
jgi:uroporphyrinogen-III synthase